MKFLAGFLAALVLLALVLAAVIYGGVYNVAATEPHTTWGEWILDTAMQRSVASRAAAVSAPDRFSDEDVRSGVQIFDGNAHLATVRRGGSVARSRRACARSRRIWARRRGAGAMPSFSGS